MPLTPHNLSESNKQRVNNILDVILSYARLEFTRKTDVIGNNDVLDAIGAGVNMLGEELESSTISLREKEHLLKEIHHRVKNNLQIVSSLLSLQSENITDQKYLELIADSRSRIHSMALVHEMLYSAKDLKRINIAEYIRHLCAGVQSTYARPNSDIEIRFDFTEGIYFDIDRMIPVGLIINEIVSNSIKYAFPNNQGLITVSLKLVSKKMKLVIKDNGIGIPDMYLKGEIGHLGLQLIHMLSEQIDGKLTISKSPGTLYSLDF
jgi:two-component sensor histidine kinase